MLRAYPWLWYPMGCRGSNPVSHVQVKHFVFCEEPEVFRLIFTELSCVCNVSCGVWGLQDSISTELPYLTLYLSERQKSMSFILEF